ncbi:GRAS family protein RAM1 [Physcomitrium patens]|uniref:GRAS family protein RAM1 n=1 Tax=Physcomitrium patens TaxID=3218 RepID=UPI000D173E8E|nr:scarecrow-like protein 18 [Physcomitrium patens]XP_024375391.1 scarecrow-like protein 18 [Physcomitrium patens]XP_024375392.1 scarecrow-like protein 18 [Physcomitrium patens]XP_024375393.1 scarecrow-like protein 18 [Physcomitrium patens]XP_024375394.1 scarecrow-like protein 18 [Physcomitrium patens]XP_024375395.1 scarecrow-like protein 18 [Physcomitrium patens]XP_024375396.1 scarecrow-like protein 18 [Physcomitrium patens]|eukprot:XP_024375390.1 scarecrow-like protein 18 [Physcomitrella patens]
MSVAQVLRSANGHQEFFPSADADYVRVLASHSRLDVHSLVLHGEGDSIANQTLKLLNERRCTPCGHWNGFSGGLMQLRDLLLETAQLISQCDWDRARPLLQLLSRRVSTTGDSSERVASCFFEALATRFSRVSGIQINELLPSRIQGPSNQEMISAYLALNQVTPFMRFAHLTANQALLEALTGENFVHIVDLEIGHGIQWPLFMQALADLRGEEGYTIQHLRITGVGQDRDVLNRTGIRLAEFAQSINLPFEFSPLVQISEHLVPRMLGLRVGEAVAINCMLQLHRLLAKGPEKLISFLCMLESLTPKVVTLAELEASHNQPHFLDRFAEALNHYSTLFDSLDATLPPTSADRIRVEQTWCKMEIVNIVACDGAERIVRHQRFELWRRYFHRAGFQLLSTSRFATSQARLLLRLHYPCDDYQLLENVDDGCLLLGWQDHPLFCVSSWNTNNM